ncbi:MAG: hypothetical protein ACM3ZO_02395 [Clostridia bacterium]
MRRAPVHAIALMVLICIAGASAGLASPRAGRAYAAQDTGTYRILSYVVSLVPEPDGSWIADYSQEWEVTGGRIPWVTVGLPDHGYTIRSGGGAAARVSRADYGSWSGVRVDLDREYVAGETFRFSFQVRQEGMGHRKGDAVTFAFVPGWYDRAETERLEVRLSNPGDAGDLLYASPEPTQKTDEEVIWTARLGRGERFKVAFEFSSRLFPDLEAGTGSRPGAADEKPAGITPAASTAVFALIVIAVVVVLTIIILAAVSRGGYTGRRGIYYGTYFPIPPAGRSSWGSRSGSSSGRGGSGSSGGSRKSGGGGGFGGRSIGCACVSCACACVSCACACACAGGGGAGCARKFDGAGAGPSRAATRVQDAAESSRHGGATEQADSSRGNGEVRVTRSGRVLRALVATAVCVWLLSTATGCRPGAVGSGRQEGGGRGLAGAPPSGAAPYAPPGQRPYDENVEVPAGDPAFPALGRYWVVDPEGLVGLAAVEAADQTLGALRADGLAETVIVVQRGVKHPADWSTHYGRWLMLGAREGPRENNGLVFLIIPDARPEVGRVWYCVGRGLPRLTSSDLGPLVEEAASYANADDLDGAVVSIARNIDDIVRKVYGEGEH